MKIELANVLQLVVLSQCLILIIFLFSNRKTQPPSRPNYWLGATLLWIVFDIFYTLILQAKLWHFINYACALGYLYGPLFWGYVKALTMSSQVVSIRKMLVHGMPFVMAILIKVTNHYISPVWKEGMGISVSQVDQYVCVVLTLVSRLHAIVYIGIIIQLIRKYHKKLPQNTSAPASYSLQWLRNLSLLMLIIFCISIIDVVIDLRTYGQLQQQVFLLRFFLVVVFIGGLLYKGLQQSLLIESSVKVNSQGAKTPKVTPEKPRYESSTLSKTDIERYLIKLQKYMAEEKPYLEFSLNREQLAEQVQLPPRELSQIINSQLNQNFYEFVNRYRVEAAKQILSDPTKKDVRANELMFDVGFNSKSTFHYTFKKFTGLTPSQFRKQALST